MEVNQEGTSMADAAGAISQLRQPVEETQEVKEEITEEVQAESVETEEVVETESEPEEVEVQAESEESEEAEELHEWNSLEELMEAAGLDQEKFDNLKTKRKINGQEEEVTLAELRAGNQRDEDYRRKTMEFSEKRKAFEEQQNEYFESQKKKVETTDFLINQLNNQLIGEHQSTNWEQLRETNPAEYAARRQEFLERQNTLQQAASANDAEKQRLIEEAETNQKKQLDNYLVQQNELLLSRIPEWTNDDVRNKETQEIAAYLKAQSYDEDLIKAISHGDHKNILLIRKAMAFDALDNKSAPKLQKLKTVPKVVKPGAKQSKTEAQQTQTAELKKRAKKTGSIHDAATLIKALRN